VEYRVSVYGYLQHPPYPLKLDTREKAERWADHLYASVDKRTRRL
jgi:hypothetical protein